VREGEEQKEEEEEKNFLSPLIDFDE